MPLTKLLIHFNHSDLMDAGFPDLTDFFLSKTKTDPAFKEFSEDRFTCGSHDIYMVNKSIEEEMNKKMDIIRITKYINDLQLGKKYDSVVFNIEKVELDGLEDTIYYSLIENVIKKIILQ